MSNAEITVNVNVEQTLHKTLCDFAQRVFDEHGVQLHRINIDWWDMSSASQQKAIVAAVQMETKTIAGLKQAG